MGVKAKGINAERELLHMFWGTGKWMALRAPASGAIKYPCPDLLVGNPTRKLAIECKTTKASKQYLQQKQIKELQEFADVFGAEPWVGVRFNHDCWYFLNLEDIDKTEGNNYVITIEAAKRKGLLFEELAVGFE